MGPSRRARALLGGLPASAARPIAAPRPDWPEAEPPLPPARDAFRLATAIARRRRRLDLLDSAIRRGVRLESSLRATEAEIPAAEARPAALQAERDELTRTLAARTPSSRLTGLSRASGA